MLPRKGNLLVPSIFYSILNSKIKASLAVENLLRLKIETTSLANQVSKQSPFSRVIPVWFNPVRLNCLRLSDHAIMLEKIVNSPYHKANTCQLLAQNYQQYFPESTLKMREMGVQNPKSDSSFRSRAAHGFPVGRFLPTKYSHRTTWMA